MAGDTWIEEKEGEIFHQCFGPSRSHFSEKITGTRKKDSDSKGPILLIWVPFVLQIQSLYSGQCNN